MALKFLDRTEAGKQLSNVLRAYAGEEALVVALPRGGVPVAVEVARALKIPLDTLVVRKLGLPQNEEVAFGAIGPHDVVYIDQTVASSFDLTESDIGVIKERESKELERRSRVLESGRWSEGKFKTVIIIDDGLATGATARVALRAARERFRPEQLVFAVPVGAADSVEALRGEADEVVCLYAPAIFNAVGLWYENFDQVSTERARELLVQTNERYVT